MLGSPKVEIISPAKFVERPTLSLAVGRATQAGITVLVSPGCHLRADQFAGPDEQRAYDFIRAWNAGSDVLWAARGGYGAGRILQAIRGRLVRGAKTFIGYSDQTYLLAHIAKNRLGKAVHGPMPVDLLRPEKQDAVDTLLGRIGNHDFAFRWEAEAESLVQKGQASGHSIVGNLSILTRLIGTADEPDWEGAILFVEDVDEYLYSLDRMFLHLAQAGILDRIAGLVLGGFSESKDNDIPFGQTVAQMALTHCRGRKMPIAAGTPFGHGPDNQPIVFGVPCNMMCADGKVTVEVAG